MKNHIQLSTRLSQDLAVEEIEMRFGREFLSRTATGGNSIASSVLKDFRKISGTLIVWDHCLHCWRLREPPDVPEVWKQSKHKVVYDRNSGNYITAHSFSEKYGREPATFAEIETFRRMYVNLVGSDHRDPDGHRREDVLMDAFPTATAQLKREPQNEWDKNAVAVFVSDKRVGYLPAETAAGIAPIIDTGDWKFIVPHTWINRFDDDGFYKYQANMIVEIRRA